MTADVSMNVEEFIISLELAAWNKLKSYRYGCMGGLIISMACIFYIAWDGGMPFLVAIALTFISALFPWSFIVGIASWVNNPGLGSVIGVPLILCTVCLPLCYLCRENISNQMREFQLPHSGSKWEDTSYKYKPDIKQIHVPKTHAVPKTTLNAPTTTVVSMPQPIAVMNQNPLVPTVLPGAPNPVVPVAEYTGPQYSSTPAQGFAL
jgi:hypothetical protein